MTMTDDPLDPGPRGDGGGPSVTVRGEAAIRTEPDEAFVFITIARTEPTSGPALADVARRVDELGRLLDEVGIGARDRSTTGITVDEEFEHTAEGRQFRGHRAATTVSVRFTEMEGIGRLIMRSSDELDARIQGPNWNVSPDHPVRLEVATQAAANALHKATAYAAGLGLRIGPVLSLAEPENHRVLHRTSRTSKSDVPIETGEQEITAVIEATFELLPPLA
jgi:uncharacterized protein YggE